MPAPFPDFHTEQKPVSEYLRAVSDFSGFLVAVIFLALDMAEFVDYERGIDVRLLHKAQFLGENSEISGSRRVEIGYFRDIGVAESVFPEVTFQKSSDSLALKRLELDDRVETAVHRGVHNLSKVCRADENPVKLLHLSQEFVDFGDFPALDSVFPVSEKRVGFVKQKDAVRFFGLLESLGDFLFRFTHIFIQKIGSAFDDDFFIEFFCESPNPDGLC